VGVDDGKMEAFMWLILENSQEPLCLPALVDSTWHFENGSEQLSIVKSSPTSKLYYCEICDSVSLIERQSGQTLELCGGALPKIDIIFGGFPCQDISAANENAKGLDGDRSGLFFEITRLASEIRPKIIFLENSPMLTTRGLHRICAKLSSLGYSCRFSSFTAAEVGADHYRKRIYLLAYANGLGLEEVESDEAFTKWPHNNSLVLPKISEKNIPKCYREDDGLPIPVGAIRSYGNAVVPMVAQAAFKKLIGIGA
jgi:DNA (cytosine-5)-methyltransferase 1